ncbi:MAG: MgtC/SapB family protein [Pseudotabrizicola sp.]|uniref:MgtC/SapB family protein n=1 Tax=Pseudotabrizicola sp. TaxID=2939647 RepID=UPI00271A4553|nr:MgtC/SapB family protein [Pseudotabrizicola sp.]MDO8884148.1 MgtC/SapB family protein [Pseudotabrizicola sp.]MDP2083192.1 MgtC/SapB family protein [Pseudotabrizicola sp.]MDZ7572609.1 MgtC/SapB family protein [Pseudotabrizicola sp.]
MVPPIEMAALNMFVALTCGALVGSERQVRQRMAGLRTNALVALGAASFVIFSALYPTEVSPTRVAAQIVSGIGFLGAGIIFRDGFNIHGLNTAATLWCSAGVGMMAGAGQWPFALLLTGMVMFVNLGLRPLVKWIKRRTKAGIPLGKSYRVLLTCRAEQEGELRSLMLRTLALGGLHLSDIKVQPAEEGVGVDLAVTVSGEGLPDSIVEQAVHRLAAEPGLIRVRWESLDEV